jgi:flagellar hook-length control protein FliK
MTEPHWHKKCSALVLNAFFHDWRQIYMNNISVLYGLEVVTASGISHAAERQSIADDGQSFAELLNRVNSGLLDSEDEAKPDATGMLPAAESDVRDVKFDKSNLLPIDNDGTAPPAATVVTMHNVHADITDPELLIDDISMAITSMDKSVDAIYLPANKAINFDTDASNLSQFQPVTAMINSEKTLLQDSARQSQLADVQAVAEIENSSTDDWIRNQAIVSAGLASTSPPVDLNTRTLISQPVKTSAVTISFPPALTDPDAAGDGLDASQSGQLQARSLSLGQYQSHDTDLGKDSIFSTMLDSSRRDFSLSASNILQQNADSTVNAETDVALTMNLLLPQSSDEPRRGSFSLPVSNTTNAGDSLATTRQLAEKWLGDTGLSIKSVLTNNHDRIRLQLSPVELGFIDIDISTMDKKASIEFVSLNMSTRELIENSLPRLKEILAESGFLSSEVFVGSESRHRQTGPGDGKWNASDIDDGLIEDDKTAGISVHSATRIPTKKILDIYA